MTVAAPTETEMRAYNRRRAFYEKIAARAAALNAPPVEPPAAIEPEAPPAEVVAPEFPPLHLPPMKKPWFYIEGAGPAPVRIQDIQEIVCAAFGVKTNDLTSARRTANLVRPRQVAMYLAKTLTGRSLPEIGRRFGGRDHTTVLHGIRKIAAKVEFNADAPQMFDPELSGLVNALRADIEAKR
jgi:hypothetical protein